MTNIVEDFYYSTEHRKYGLYVKSFDRFVLVDNKDIWVMLQTAEILSSKIASVVYLLPYEQTDINNLNCCSYRLTNKKSQTMGTTPLIFSAQSPVLRTLIGNVLEFADNRIPGELKDYAEFVHKHSYALSFTEAFTRYDETYSFAEKYLPVEWRSNLTSTYTRDTTSQGLFFEIRKALYLSNSIQQAEDALNHLWSVHGVNQPWIRNLYFKLLDQKVPEGIDSNGDPSLYTGYAG